MRLKKKHIPVSLASVQASTTQFGRRAPQSWDHRTPIMLPYMWIFKDNTIPTEALRKWFPILVSLPIALATSDTSAPVASQIALMALMLEIRCARKAFAACRK